MGNDIVLQDAEMLKLLTGMANKDDGGGTVAGPPTLKINYAKRSKYTLGAWVVGQKKAQDGSVAEEGELVRGLVILLARNRWSFYNSKDTTQNCNSPFYLRGEIVKGNNYGYVCGKTCPKRAEGINPRCKCQIVLFGKAVTQEGKFVDCISYLGGDSYMPTQSYIEGIEIAKGKGGYVQIPLFTFLTLLESVEKTNQGTDYFQAKFVKGPMFKEAAQFIEFDKARNEVLQYIERSNTFVPEDDTSSAAGQAPASVAPATQQTTVSQTVQDDSVIDVKPEPAAAVAAASTTDIPDFAKMITGASSESNAPEVSAAPFMDSLSTQQPNPSQIAQQAPKAGGNDFDLPGKIQMLLQDKLQ